MNKEELLLQEIELLKAELDNLKLSPSEKDFVIQALEEGSEEWQNEAERLALSLRWLVDLKDLHDKPQKSRDEEKLYAMEKPEAWERARRLLKETQAGRIIEEKAEKFRELLHSNSQHIPATNTGDKKPPILTDFHGIDNRDPKELPANNNGDVGQEGENSDRYIPAISEADYDPEQYQKTIERRKAMRDIIAAKFEGKLPQGWGLIAAAMEEYASLRVNETTTPALDEKALQKVAEDYVKEVCDQIHISDNKLREHFVHFYIAAARKHQANNKQVAEAAWDEGAHAYGQCEITNPETGEYEGFDHDRFFKMKAEHISTLNQNTP